MVKLCLQLPWPPKPASGGGAGEVRPAPPCAFEAPFLFRTLQGLQSVAAAAFGALKSEALPAAGERRTAAEQGELEQRALAAALASGKAATVLEFYSPKCRLCGSLLGLVGEVESRNTDWLNVVMADAENEKWLPEVFCLLFSLSFWDESWIAALCLLF